MIAHRGSLLWLMGLVLTLTFVDVLSMLGDSVGSFCVTSCLVFFLDMQLKMANSFEK